VVYPILEFREEKQAFTKIKRNSMDFSLFELNDSMERLEYLISFGLAKA